MKTVIGQFIDHIQEYEYTAGQPNGQSKYVYKAVSEVFKQVAEGNLDNVCNHSSPGLAVIIIRRCKLVIVTVTPNSKGMNRGKLPVKQRI
jgi:hypothetical protein